MPSHNETWLIKVGDRVIQKKAAVGIEHLVPWEVLVYALWWADYAMRNGESLEAAEANCGFHANGILAARQLSLPKTRELFALDLDNFESAYLDRFEAVCNEIRTAEPSVSRDCGGII